MNQKNNQEENLLGFGWFSRWLTGTWYKESNVQSLGIQSFMKMEIQLRRWLDMKKISVAGQVSDRKQKILVIKPTGHDGKDDIQVW